MSNLLKSPFEQNTATNDLALGEEEDVLTSIYIFYP
jgi:hypothetical protein